MFEAYKRRLAYTITVMILALNFTQASTVEYKVI